MEEPKETLLVEVMVGDILVEGITGNPLETAMTGHTLETGTEINHNKSTEGPRVILETIIIARKGRGMTETDVKEEVQVRKEVIDKLILDHVSGKVSTVKAVSWGTSVFLIMLGCFLLCLCRGNCLFCIPQCIKDW